ncbi:MAG: hypothetical protein A2020_12980 [Lentisphaerae bacterium GWF2_45_14]|nr:MAG: hypothetical protein A2020_12980 [Lentisphaerae bacterium GWF2_45_14]
MKDKKVGIIGAGGRGLGLARSIAYSNHNMRVASLCDKYEERAQESKESIERVFSEAGKPTKVRTYSDYKELIDNDDLDLIMITAPQFFHEEPFRYALKKGKRVFCEKPLAHSMEAIDNMYDAWTENNKKNAMVGFTRRYENTWRRAKEIIDKGWIGNVKMTLMRSVIHHPSYFHKWYSQVEYSGGVLNEKSAHHFDVLNWFSGAKPQMISAMGGRSVYTPQDAYPEWCNECDKNCEYRFSYNEDFKNQSQRQSPIYIKTAVNSKDEFLAKDKCVYAKDTNTIDHAIVNISYENGIKGQLFLSVFGYHTEDMETLEVVGDKGKLRLERVSGKIEVDYDYGREHMTIDARGKYHNDGTGHFGADIEIINAINGFVCNDIKPPANVYDGYIASRMSFLATESCKTNKVYEI